MAGIDYSQKIPNNVDLKSDKRLQRALEHWQPDYIEWWKEMGPTDFNENDVYLRTAVSVEKDGWANFGYVKMPEYRWGIFLTPNETDPLIKFGDHRGAPAWEQVPGEYRNWLRRLIVTQGDTEPASVEQQRLLGHTAPSLYDMRNLFQVNVEEGRHLWAMVYLLHRHFGADGRDEADEMLQRRSGNPDHPRILSTFNEPIDEWLSFFCFTMFTDRDGKFQLLSLAESGFDPLARTTRFMLTEEAHHMFVGQTGIQRIVRRACELMKQHPDSCPSEHGGIPLSMIQKYINFWASNCYDLFGAEVSSNSANFFAAGLKGRAYEEKFEDHDASTQFKNIERFVDGKLFTEEVPMRNAMNEVLREAYIADNQKGVDAWNKEVAKHGIDFEFYMPSSRFNRKVGEFAGGRFHVKSGEHMTETAYMDMMEDVMPNHADRAHVKSLMVGVREPGKFAGWISPPLRGINGQPVEFEYVRM